MKPHQVGIPTDGVNERIPKGWARTADHEHTARGGRDDPTLPILRSAVIVSLNRDHAPMIQPTLRQFINGIAYTNIHPSSVSDSRMDWMR